MQLERVTIVTRDGSNESCPADLYRCDECDGEEWIVYRLVGHAHIHMQCVHCETTYCQAGDACTIPGETPYD